MLVSTNMHINWFKKAQNSTSTYEVVSGDTISGIAKKLLGNADLWKEIVKLNPNITNPDLIHPGMSLTIPAIRTDAVLKPSEKESTKIPVSPKNPTQTKQMTAIVSGSSASFDLLRKEIARGEGGYDSYNRGNAGDSMNNPLNIKISSMTIGDILSRQNKKELLAVGKYQFIPITFKETVAAMGISLDTIFSASVQDTMLNYLVGPVKRKILYGYLTGKHNDIDAAIDDLCKEFASMPCRDGAGRYDGNAGNKSHGGIERVNKIKNILKLIRESKEVS